jgi:hydroxymethylbilane synthase
MKETLTIGTRGSALARVQARIVRERLQDAHPTLHIIERIIETTGDKNQSPIPLDQVGKGWFTKEIEQALISSDIDIAVHSLKDMADVSSSGLTIGAYVEREDARDVLVSREKVALAKLPKNPVIGTDSMRRKVQIEALRPDAMVTSIRGNVPTRIDKLDQGAYDAVVLAAAGLRRLSLTDRIAEYFPVDVMTPAPGQGILAVQLRSNDVETGELVKVINNKIVATAAIVERDFSRACGGGCKSPTGAYAVYEGREWTLHGMHEARDTLLRGTLQLHEDEVLMLGQRLAKEMGV